jgi:hypothetical protein
VGDVPDLLFTNKRLLVRPTYGKEVESILYRSIASFRTGHFITDDLVLKVIDRGDDLELSFDSVEKRDEVLAIVTKLTTQ